MTMLQRLISTMALLFLAACGGGGGDAGTPPFGGTDIGTNKPGHTVDRLPRVPQRPLIGVEGLRSGIGVQMPDPVGDFTAGSPRKRRGPPQTPDTVVPPLGIGHQYAVGTGRTRALPFRKESHGVR